MVWTLMVGFFNKNSIWLFSSAPITEAKNRERLHKMNIAGKHRSTIYLKQKIGPSWSYGSWFYNYLCNQCLSPLKLWVRTPLMARCILCNIMWWSFQWLATGLWFSPDTLVSSTNKTNRHDITEILLKVVLNTITLTQSRKSVSLSFTSTHFCYIKEMLRIIF